MHPIPQQNHVVSALPVDGTGFQIGWDHAHHGLVPPGPWMRASSAVFQGWSAAKAVFGLRTLRACSATRSWLALRLLARQCGWVFENQQVTPNYLKQIQVQRCPVRRQSLGGAPGQADAAVHARINPDGGVAAGNLVQLSAAAALLLEQVDVEEAVRRARRAECTGAEVEGQDAATWWRLAALRAFATPLPFALVARLPLALLPPNRVRLLNAVQGLQALVTQMFAAPGWSARCQALARLLPDHTLRQDFNLFVGAMAPRVLEAGPGRADLRRALEDAWLGERVQRRWQHLVLSLGEAGTESLLAQVVGSALAQCGGVRVLSHAPEQATEGWSLRAGSDRTALGRSRAGVRHLRQLKPFAPLEVRPGTSRPPSAPASHA